MCALVTGVQTCALPIWRSPEVPRLSAGDGRAAVDGDDGHPPGQADAALRLRSAAASGAPGEFPERQRVVKGKRVSERVGIGGRRHIQQKISAQYGKKQSVE